MKELTTDEIECLSKLGDKCNCEMCLPPFNGTNHIFYYLNEFSNYNILNFWLTSSGYTFEFVKIDDKEYIEVTGGYNDKS